MTSPVSGPRATATGGRQKDRHRYRRRHRSSTHAECGIEHRVSRAEDAVRRRRRQVVQGATSSASPKSTKYPGHRRTRCPRSRTADRYGSFAGGRLLRVASARRRHHVVKLVLVFFHLLPDLSVTPPPLLHCLRRIGARCRTSGPMRATVAATRRRPSAAVAPSNMTVAW